RGHPELAVRQQRAGAHAQLPVRLGVTAEVPTGTVTRPRAVAPLRALFGRLLGLPPPVTRRGAGHRDLPGPKSDGTVLRADHHDPLLGRVPTVLVRTPYGRGGPTSLLAGAVAARGFHVLVQACRGTGGSAGEFEPMLNERSDGVDTLG